MTVRIYICSLPFKLLLIYSKTTSPRSTIFETLKFYAKDLDKFERRTPKFYISLMGKCKAARLTVLKALERKPLQENLSLEPF